MTLNDLVAEAIDNDTNLSAPGAPYVSLYQGKVNGMVGIDAVVTMPIAVEFLRLIAARVDPASTTQ